MYQDVTPSGARWRQLYAHGEPPVVLHRTGLVQRILGDGNPWTAIAAAPGMGKTTLLQQTAMAYRESGRDVTVLPLFSRHTPPVLVEGLARGSIGPNSAVLIDDFDWFDVQAGARWIVDELLASGARLVTASVDSPSWAVSASEAPDVIGPADLSFTRTEHAELFRAADLGPDSAAAEELVWQVARGGAAGTAFCLETLVRRPGDMIAVEQSYKDLASVSLLICRNDVPADSTGRGMLASSQKIRLLPQLSVPLVASFLGQAAADSLDTLSRQPTVLEPARAREHYFEWAEAFWNAFNHAGLDNNEMRLLMADDLRKLGAAIDELWQRIFLGHWERAEEILAEEYLRAEALLPGVVRAHLIGANVAGFPLCESLQLSTRASADGRTSRTRSRNFVRRGVDVESPVRAALVRALQSRAALHVADAASAEARFREAWSLLRALPVARRSDSGFISAVAVLARVLAGLNWFGGAWNALLWISRRTELQREDQDLFRALESLAYFYPERGIVELPADGSGSCPLARAGVLAVERGVASAAWVLLDAGEPRLASEFVRARCSGTSEAPDVGISDAANLLGLLLSGDSAEALREFDRIQGEGSVSTDSPLTKWMGIVALLAEGRSGEAADLLTTLPADWELTRIATLHFHLIVGNRARAAEPDHLMNHLGPRGRAFKAVVRAVGLARDGFAERVRESLLNAHALGGAGSVRLALTLLPRADVELFASALERDAEQRGVRRSGEEELRRLIANRLEESDVFSPPARTISLTERELIVLAAIDRGMSLAEIASEEFVSVNTVKSQINSLKRKLGVTGPREAAVEAAVQLGLIRRR